MGNMHIVTGFKGENHITAADIGSFQAAVVGVGQYVLERGGQLAATTITNNKIRISYGDLLMQGRHVRLNEGTYVDLTIDNGQSGYLRNDLIVARYTKDSSSGVEDVNLVVIKGTPAASSPADPAYTTGDIINDHVYVADMPLWRVPLNGLTVQTLVKLFTVVRSLNTHVHGNLTNDGRLGTVANLPVFTGANGKITAVTTSAGREYMGAAAASHVHGNLTNDGKLGTVANLPVFTGANGVLEAKTVPNARAALLPSGSVTSDMVANGAITAAKIAEAAVSAVYVATASTTWVGSAAPYSQAIAVPGLLATDRPIIDVFGLTASDAETKQNEFAKIYKAVADAGTLTLYATEKPTAAISIQILVVRK